MKCYVVIVFNNAEKLIESVGRAKAFQVRFLIDITILRAPPINRMRRLLAVYGRLGIDGQKTLTIEVDKMVTYRGNFRTDRAVAPREILDGSEDVICKEIAYICNGSREPPPLSSFIGRALEPNTVQVKFSVGGRPCVSPSSVGKLIPLLRSCDIALVAILPEDRPYILFLSSICKTLRSTRGGPDDLTCLQGNGFLRFIAVVISNFSKIINVAFSRFIV